MNEKERRSLMGRNRKETRNKLIETTSKRVSETDQEWNGEDNYKKVRRFKDDQIPLQF